MGKINEYKRPSIDFLREYQNTQISEERKNFIIETVEQAIRNCMHCDAKVVSFTDGATISKLGVEIPKCFAVKNTTDCAFYIKENLKIYRDIRIYRDFKSYLLYFEIPNEQKNTVGLKKIIQSEEFQNSREGSLVFAIGENAEGKSIVGDITKLPHLFIGGSTGTGKSVCLYSMILSLMYKYSPSELKFVLVDPKLVEFSPFKGMPHLYYDEIIGDYDRTVLMLDQIISEMDSRYNRISERGVYNLTEYNNTCEKEEDKLCRIVIIIDEISDLICYNKSKKIESSLVRLMAKSRAAGIHVVITTQRSTKNIPATVKANINSCIGFRTASYADSKAFIGEKGCETLIGWGDCLYKNCMMQTFERVQGAFVSFDEAKKIINFVKENNESSFFILPPEESKRNICDDNIYVDCLKFAVTVGAITISGIQRKFSFGYAKATKIVDRMIEEGYVEIDSDGKKRLLLSKEEFDEKFGKL